MSLTERVEDKPSVHRLHLAENLLDRHGAANWREKNLESLSANQIIEINIDPSNFISLTAAKDLVEWLFVKRTIEKQQVIVRVVIPSSNDISTFALHYELRRYKQCVYVDANLSSRMLEGACKLPLCVPDKEPIGVIGQVTTTDWDTLLFVRSQGSTKKEDLMEGKGLKPAAAYNRLQSCVLKGLIYSGFRAPTGRKGDPFVYPFPL